MLLLYGSNRKGVVYREHLIKFILKKKNNNIENYTDECLSMGLFTTLIIINNIIRLIYNFAV